MRFTLNAFIVSTVTLLSLITPVVNAIGDNAQITSPAAGQTVKAKHPIQVTWDIVDLSGLDETINFGMGLVDDNTDPNLPLTPNILATAPVLSTQLEVTIPDVSGDFYFEMISDNQSILFGRSFTFKIVC